MIVAGLFGGGYDLGGPLYVIQDLLNYIRVSNVGDNAHGAATQWAQVKHSQISGRIASPL
jgi:hypothetical protein